MHSGNTIDHPELGKLEYNTKLKDYEAQWIGKEGPIKYSIAADANNLEDELAFAAEIFRSIDQIISDSKAYVCYKMLDDANEWRLEHELPITEESFQDRLTKPILTFFGDRTFDLNYTTDMFGDHYVLVYNRNGEFYDAYFEG
ncbi:MAG: DUF2262 domain-containing protein [Planctomycetota bacterium]